MFEKLVQAILLTGLLSLSVGFSPLVQLPSKSEAPKTYTTKPGIL